MKYVYGPVKSWRLGNSLGVDLLSQKQKQCSFNCSYCQVGPTPFYVLERKVFVPTEDVVKEVLSVKNRDIDYITFSGNGEPTLALNLGETIKKIKQKRKEKVAVLTNSSLLFRKDVREELSYADMVQCKLDAATDRTFAIISTQSKAITYNSIIAGLKLFRQEYKGELCLQIMFLQSNINEAKQFVLLAKEINPDLIELNTPLRKSQEKPITPKQMEEIKKLFYEFNVRCVYDKHRDPSVPIDKKTTEKRRGKEL
jgi:wyosine [tRNA(Phe)-imidazoG37] synthetase (radical SAM superfamily)